MAEGVAQEVPAVDVEVVKGKVVAARGLYNRAWMYMSSSTGVSWDAIVVLKRGNSTAVEFTTFDSYDTAITLATASALLALYSVASRLRE